MRKTRREVLAEQKEKMKSKEAQDYLVELSDLINREEDKNKETEKKNE